MKTALLTFAMLFSEKAILSVPGLLLVWYITFRVMLWLLTPSP